MLLRVKKLIVESESGRSFTQKEDIIIQCEDFEIVDLTGNNIIGYFDSLNDFRDICWYTRPISDLSHVVA